MPNNIIKGLMKDTRKSEKEVEKAFNKAKSITSEDFGKSEKDFKDSEWAYTTEITKRILGLDESLNNKENNMKNKHFFESEGVDALDFLKSKLDETMVSSSVAPIIKDAIKKKKIDEFDSYSDKDFSDLSYNEEEEPEIEIDIEDEDDYPRDDAYMEKMIKSYMEKFFKENYEKKTSADTAIKPDNPDFEGSEKPVVNGSEFEATVDDTGFEKEKEASDLPNTSAFAKVKESKENTVSKILKEKNYI